MKLKLRLKWNGEDMTTRETEILLNGLIFGITIGASIALAVFIAVVF